MSLGMDLESLFLNHFAIEKTPNIFNLIKAAIHVGTWKYPTRFKKHKDEILMMLLNPEKPGIGDEIDSASTDEEEDEVIDSASDEEQDEEIDSVGDEKEDEEIDSGGVEFSVDDLHQTEKNSSSRFQETDQETGQILGREGNYNVSKAKSTLLKVRLSLNKTRDIDDKLQHKHVDSDKEKKTEVGKCLSDSTESKNMSCVTGSATKNSPGGLRKMNKDINHVEEKQDCSSQKIKRRIEGGGQLQKQRNCSAITRPNQKTPHSSTVARPMQKPAQSSTVATPMEKPAQSSTVGRTMQKVTQSSTVGRPVQKVTQSTTVARPLMEKTTQSINDMKSSGMKFESSKRKFEERVAEQKNAKRRIIMVDFHDMPKPAKDPSAPKRCWDRRRRS
ncbi:uncharacterized protein [Nicotiana sylvestris]|uniref:uncharacterized protein n=1 Tax=Nicotiana sylvestris TaxID=4096 RepID=UPI00388C6DF9